MKSILFRHGLAVFILSIAFASLADNSTLPRERVSLNAGWRFARFDLTNNGSLLPKPGQPQKAVTASSEEPAKTTPRTRRLTAIPTRDGAPPTEA
jgi:hypothetical protein